MKKTMLLLVGVTIFSFSFSFSFAWAKEPILIATGEYTPYTSQKLKSNGFVNHVISEAFKKEGYTVKFTYLPWKRGSVDTERGRYHATSYWFQSEDRRKTFYYSDPVITEKYFFFHLKSNPIRDWSTLSDLKEYRIGATIGSTYTKEFWDATKSGMLKVQAVPHNETNIKKLLIKRIDLFPTGLVAGFALIRQHDPDKVNLVTYLPTPFRTETGHLWFPKKRKDSYELMLIFNRGLAKLKKEGIYKKMEDNLQAGKYEK